MWFSASPADKLGMRVWLFALLLVAPVLPATPPSRPARAGCPAALELFRQYVALEPSADRYSLFSPKAVVRLYGETSSGQDLGHKDVSLDEYRAAVDSATSRRYRGIRCETEGSGWLVTAQRSEAEPHQDTPVSFLIGYQDERLRILSASFVHITAE